MYICIGNASIRTYLLNTIDLFRLLGQIYDTKRVLGRRYQPFKCNKQRSICILLFTIYQLLSNGVIILLNMNFRENEFKYLYIIIKKQMYVMHNVNVENVEHQ